MADPYDPHRGTPPRIPGYQDGYCGHNNGDAETQSDSVDLDANFWPHRPQPISVPFDMNDTFETMQAKRQAAEEAHEREEYWESRCFELDPDTAMGANLSPDRKTK